MRSLTADAARLLTAPALTVSAGCELLDLSLQVVEDISDDLEGGKVARSLFATIHSTCTLRLARPLAWGVDLVRPYQVLSDGVTTERFNLGVYLLTTPDRKVGQTPETYEVQGFDRLLLLSRQVGADYTVLAGTSYRTAILDVFAAAGLSSVLIEGVAADDVLPADKSYPLVADRAADPDQTDSPTTYLRIVNDLARAINFRAVFCDENGFYRLQAYQPPARRAAEFTFDADDVLAGIVGEDRTVAVDVWDVPNRWVFRQTNRPSGSPVAVEGDGVYTVVNQSDGATSVDGRGLVWTSVVDYEAATQAKLVDLGDRRVQSDRSRTERYDVTVGPFPAAGHADIYRYRDAAAGVDVNVQLVAYEIDLTGADTSMTWERL